jgi:RNA polymerase sigma-70 factor (ECF subfamily)
MSRARPERTAATLALPWQAERAGEAQFVAELKARRPDAWAALYDTHYRQIHRYAFVRGGSREVAEDLAATVFSRALTAIDAYSYSGRPLLAWLYGIARNVVSEHRREASRASAGSLARAVRDSLGARGPLIPDGSSGAADPALLIEGLDLRHALARLTRDQREAILLRYVAGLSAREAGAVLGRPEGAVYSLQSRALAALRRHLAEP